MGLLLSMVLLFIPCSNVAMAIDTIEELVGTERLAGTYSGAYYIQSPYNSTLYVSADGYPVGTGIVTYDYITLKLRASSTNSTTDIELERIRRWVFDYIETGTYKGYYTIKNSYTMLYMTVEDSSSSDNTDIIFSEFTGESGQYWSIEQTSAGYYKLIPYCGVSSGIVMGVNSNTDYTDIKAKTYVSNADYKDEWVLIDCTQNILMEGVYDNGYYNRYTYDADYRTTTLLFDMREFYLSEFGIKIRYTSVPTMYQSLADTCGTDYATLCTHGTCQSSNLSTAYTYHHKNIYNVYYNTVFPDITENLKIVFIGHNCCYNDNNGTPNDASDDNHITTGINGVASQEYGMALISRHDSYEGELATTIHETGHLFGTIDHSSGQTANLNIERIYNLYDDNCIYGAKKYTPTVVNNLMICDACKATIVAGRDYYGTLN